MTKSLDTALGAVSKIGKLEVIKAEHTPTPWSMGKGYKSPVCCLSSIVSDKGNQDEFIVAYVNGGHDTVSECGANSAFIVRAVNAHDALVEALDEMLGNCTGQNFEDINPSHLPDGSTVHKAYMALKLARGEE